MTKEQGHFLYFKAVNHGKQATKPVEVYEKQATETRDWNQVMWYKWDRVVQMQSGTSIAIFDHEEE